MKKNTVVQAEIKKLLAEREKEFKSRQDACTVIKRDPIKDIEIKMQTLEERIIKLEKKVVRNGI